MASLIAKSIAAQMRRLEEFKRATGIAMTGVRLAQIPEAQTFREWCEELGANGLKVDGFPFTLANRPAMHFIYDLVPTTIQEAFQKTVVMMKCAQVGFTVMEMLASIYLALKFEPCKVGMYLPDMKLAAAKSSVRFLPIVRTVPQAYHRLTTAEDSAGKRRASEGNVMIREMGESHFYFLWTSGRATTESFPMDVLSFDEVQGMKIADMEKTQERISASRVKFTLMGSTANWPDQDIHFWYKRGTQHQFWTRCPHCDTDQIIDDHFPDCIQFDDSYVAKPGAAPGEYRYVCHSCRGWIDDPQLGEWRPVDPTARIISVHFPQFLSPTISPREIFEAYINADDMANFYNRKRGKPYTDPSQVPVNMSHLNACAEAGRLAGVVWKDRGRDTFMGIDQMGAFNVAVIKERLPDGRQAIIHMEYIFDVDPFQRCSALMGLYGVQMCVVETLPNFNDAHRFAQRHPGRVFLAHYEDIKDEMMVWGDDRLNRAQRKINEGEQVRYTVKLDQYKCMQTSMARIQRAMVVFPDPGGLVQEVLSKGLKRPMAVLKDVAYKHFMHTALLAVKDPEQKKFRRKVVKVGTDDPHTSYANMLCDVAWARAYGTGMILLPGSVDGGPETERAQQVAAEMPGLPASVLQMIDAGAPGTCARCASFAEGRCVMRNFNVAATDVACEIFEAAILPPT